MKTGELLIKGKKYEEAQKEFQEILKFDPDNRDVKIALGLLYYDMNRIDAAIEEFSSILSKNPQDHKVRYLLANAYEEKKESQLAVEAYKKIPTTSELFASAQIRAGFILKKETNLAGAIALIENAIRQRNDQISLHLFLSSLYEEAQDFQAAENVLREGIGVSPRTLELHYALGVIYEKMNRFEESIGEMKKVLEIDPENAEALNFIGYSYAERNLHLDEAETMILRAMELKPDNGYFIDSLGWVYFKKNKMTQALKYLKQAHDLLPEEVEIMLHLAEVYVGMNKVKEAKDLYEKVLKIDSQNKIAQQKLEELTGNKR